jgi:hypothetical protein
VVEPALSHDTAAALVVAYLGAWTERRSGARRRLLQHCWSEAGTFSSWTTHVEGIDAMDAHIAAALRQLPRRCRRTRTSEVHVSDNKLSFTWALFDQDDGLILEGSEFAEVGPDGLFLRVTSFSGRPESQMDDLLEVD